MPKFDDNLPPQSNPGRDQLYLGRPTTGSDFQFDSGVAAVFDDMIERSVPLYRETQRVTVELAESRYQLGSSIVDIGCSTGTTLAGLATRQSLAQAKLIGIEPSAPMLKRCAARLANVFTNENAANRIELIQADALTGLAQISSPPSVAILNYTLQFIEPEKRQSLLEQLQQTLLPGACLILSEKVRAEDDRLNQTINDLHLQFKRDNGYSELEISRKRDALEQVLIPWTVEQNYAALRTAGFKAIEIVLKGFQFTTFVATN